MINNILYFLASFLPLRIIDREGLPYLERYYLFTFFRVRFYLHRFVAEGDVKERYHNHPYPWSKAVILCGGYFEDVLWRCSKLKETIYQTSTVDITRDRMHWITKIDHKTWTLFFHTMRERLPWGFYDEEGECIVCQPARNTEWHKAVVLAFRNPKRQAR